MVSPSPNAIAGWMTNANPSLPHAAVAQGPPGLVQAPNTGMLKVIVLNGGGYQWRCSTLSELLFLSAAFLKHPRTPTSAPGIDYQSADSEHLMKRMRVGQPDEVSDELKIYLCLTSLFFCIFITNKLSLTGIFLWCKPSC